jgi:hypothetical protein
VASTVAAAGPFSANDHRELVRLLSAPLAGPGRVRTLSRLLEALRLLEAEREAAGAGRVQRRPLSLFFAVALHELDALVDSLTYEELWEAFGGEPRLPQWGGCVPRLFLPLLWSLVRSNQPA